MNVQRESGVLEMENVKLDIENEKLKNDIKDLENEAFGLKESGNNHKSGWNPMETDEIKLLKANYVQAKQYFFVCLKFLSRNIGDVINMFHNKKYKLKQTQIDEITSVLMR